MPINNGSFGGNKADYTVGKSQRVLDLDAQFPADALQAVSYRGAHWKAEIGRWLSGCDSVSQPVDINEVLNRFPFQMNMISAIFF